PRHYAVPQTDAVRQDAASQRLALGNAHAWLANGRLALKQYQDALKSSEAALYYLPGDAFAAQLRMLALYALNRPQEAETAQQGIESLLRNEKAIGALLRSRDRFIRQVCGEANPPEKTCAGKLSAETAPRQ